MKEVPLKDTAAAEKMVHLVALSKRVDEGGRDVMRWGSRLVNHLLNQLTRPLGMMVPSPVTPVPPKHLPPAAGSNRDKRPSAQKPWDTHSKGRTPPFFLGLTWSVCVTGFLIICIDVTKGEGSPHQPYRWSLIRWDDSRTLKVNTTAGSPSFNIVNYLKQ